MTSGGDGAVRGKKIVKPSISHWRGSGIDSPCNTEDFTHSHMTNPTFSLRSWVERALSHPAAQHFFFCMF
jgi:hypothetical protein